MHDIFYSIMPCHLNTITITNDIGQLTTITSLWVNDAIWRIWTESLLVQIIRLEATTRTNADLLSIVHLETHVSELFRREKAFENILSTMSGVLFNLQWVNEKRHIKLRHLVFMSQFILSISAFMTRVCRRGQQVFDLFVCCTSYIWTHIT